MPYADLSQRREYQRTWYATNRANFFADKSCVQCGSTDRMELDHVDPDQKVSHRIWSWSAERRAAEISKCQVLCHDCHLEKTTADRNARITHGKEWAYRMGCRCTPCIEARHAYNEHRRNRRLAAKLVA